MYEDATGHGRNVDRIERVVRKANGNERISNENQMEIECEMRPLREWQPENTEWKVPKGDAAPMDPCVEPRPDTGEPYAAAGAGEP